MVWNFVIQLAIVLVATLVTNALRPRPEGPKAASLSDVDAPTAEDGRPVPVIFGTVLIKGPNVIWFGDMRTSAITKGGGKK
jgi:hypothetical protein